MQAYHHNIRYPTHLLVTFQWYGSNWWLVEDQNYTCTGEERGEVLDMTLSVDIFGSSYLDSDVYKNTSMNIVGWHDMVAILLELEYSYMATILYYQKF